MAPTDPVGSRLYRLLGRRYRASYTVDDRVALGEARLTFLMNDLPLAARLLTHFQRRRYEVRYLDDTRTHFWGRKEDQGLACVVTTTTLDEGGDTEAGYCIYPEACIRRMRVIKRRRQPRKEKP